MSDRVHVLQAESVARIMIDIERSRQDEKWGRLPRDISWGTWLAVLMEEVGEAAKEVVEHDDGTKLVKELCHVAAVSQAWMADIMAKWE